MVQESCRLARFIVLAEADERLPDLIVREEFGGSPRVFGGNQIDLLEGPECSEREVLKVADWGGHDEERARHGWEKDSL
jgi:hypothetical protein